MAILGFAVVTLVYLILLFQVVHEWQYVAATRAYGLFALWAFGLRFDHVLAGVTWLINSVSNLL